MLSALRTGMAARDPMKPLAVRRDRSKSSTLTTSPANRAAGFC